MIADSSYELPVLFHQRVAKFDKFEGTSCLRSNNHMTCSILIKLMVKRMTLSKILSKPQIKEFK